MVTKKKEIIDNRNIDIEFCNVSKNYFLCKNDFERLQTVLFSFERKKRLKPALNNVSFRIYEGEKVAIMGKNGAGKSTLLKIISNIVKPSSGKVVVNRKISSLLDVGVGMEPEFTGRDNIYIRGTLLGYSKKEINEVIDKIIDFSGLREYVDLEMKRYSSGMISKLGFSINLFFNPEILIVDEALSVGDVDFNNKAKQEIIKLSKEKKTTLLIVSHNEDTINGLCDRGICILNNKIAFDGEFKKCLEFYNKNIDDKKENN